MDARRVIVLAAVAAAALAPAPAPQYKMLDNFETRCSDVGYNTITSLKECAQAAKALNLPHRVPFLTGILDWGDTPYGCYLQTKGFLTKGLWLNPDGSSTANGSSHGDQPVCALPPPGEYAIQGLKHKITSWDGTRLSADSEHPLTANVSEKFPLIVFTNSWVCPEIEYLVKTIQWAKRGYVMLEYEARGWYDSSGQIGVAGPEDVKDMSAVIDWALKTFPMADPEAIAVAGVSYGAGISLLTTGSDDRIKAAFVMSGWSDLFKALNWQDTPSLAWGKLLEVTGELPFIGREPQVVRDNLKDLYEHKNMSFIRTWAQNRSGINFLDRLNARKPAIYMSHQHEDNLFHSSIEVDTWERLQLPKHLDLNQGTHASAELLGLLGIDVARTASNHIWNTALMWADHFLKGKANGVEKLPPVQMQLGNEGIKSEYVSFGSWPPTEDWTVERYFLGPRQGTWGSLGQTAPAALNLTDTISFSAKHQRMTTGTIFVSDMFKDLLPITAKLEDADPAHSVVFASGVLHGADATRVCGIPRLSGLSVVPNETQFQVVAYLYDLDVSSGRGRLITHGVSSVWGPVPKGQLFTFPNITFHSCCFEISPGHAVALGVNMFDGLYKPVSTNASFGFVYQKQAGGPAAAALELPILGSVRLPDFVVPRDPPEDLLEPVLHV